MVDRTEISCRRPVWAIPENGYHFSLLSVNEQVVDLFLIKSDSKLLGSEILGKRNVEVFDSDFFSPNILAAMRANKKFYSKLGNRFAGEKPEKLIIFADAKPYHRFLIDFCIENGITIELWEDGLGYYLGAGVPMKYALGNLAKFACGCYVKKPFSEQYRRNAIVLRDRFIHKNLIFKKPHSVPEARRDRVAFIGQPLVEDGYMSLKKYCAYVEQISINTGVVVDYLPHPREGGREFDPSMVNVINGVKTEEWLNRVEYLHCSTAFSTAMINVGDFQRRSFCAGHFGLTSIARALEKFPIFGVEVIRKFRRLDIH